MNSKIGLRWKIYFFLFLPIACGNALSVVYPESPLYVYYHVLISFHKDYMFFYLLNVINALVNTLCLIPLFLYVFQVSFLSKRLWQWLFVIRIIFDIIGHDYEIKFFKSLFYINVWYGLSSLILLIALTIPSYFACFRYAFRQK